MAEGGSLAEGVASGGVVGEQSRSFGESRRRKEQNSEGRAEKMRARWSRPSGKR